MKKRIKLLTLKDLIKKIDNHDLPYIETDKLRKEITKHIKYIEKEGTGYCQHYDEVIEFIKYFFNIN